MMEQVKQEKNWVCQFFFEKVKLNFLMEKNREQRKHQMALVIPVKAHLAAKKIYNLCNKIMNI